MNEYERDEVHAADKAGAEANKLRIDAEAIILSDNDDPYGQYFNFDYDSESDFNFGTFSLGNTENNHSFPPIMIESLDIDPVTSSKSSPNVKALANEFDDAIANEGLQSTSQSIPNQMEDDFRLISCDIDFHHSDNENDDDKEQLLPIRIKCAAHTLNLIGKIDAVKALADKSYARAYLQAVSKLNLLWKYCGYRKNCEIIKKYVGKVILRPHKIRWNALYNSVSRKQFF